MTAASWGLPSLAAGQASPEVTVNSIADLLAAGAPPPVLRSITETAPPGTPAEFDLYGVPAGATGAWAGEAGKLARYHLAGWHFIEPPTPFRAFVEDEAAQVILTADGWVRGAVVSPWGAATGLLVRELLVDCSSGSAVTVSGLILDRDCVFGLSYCSLGVTGPTSIDVGVAGELDRYGDDLNPVSGSANIGNSGTPLSYFADTDVVVTANGGAFTGGEIRLAAHVLRMTAPGAA